MASRKTNATGAVLPAIELDATSPVVSQRRGDSSDSSERTGDASASAGTDDSSSSDSDEFGNGNGNSGPSGSAGDESGDGDFDLPLGGGRATRDGDPTRNGRGRARAGSRRRTRADSSRAETAETGTASDSETPPREVAYESLGKASNKKISAKESALSKEFFQETWGLLFHGASVAFRDPEWKLPEDDALELAERTQKWMRSGGSKRMAAIEKMIAQYEPSLSLIMGLAAVVGPRIAHTRNLRRALRPQTQQESAGRTREAAPVSSSAPASNSAVADAFAGRDARAQSANGNGRHDTRYRPVGRQDFYEISGDNDG